MRQCDSRGTESGIRSLMETSQLDTPIALAKFPEG